MREDRDALVAQQALVPLEGLAAGGVLGGVAGDLVRDGVEGQRLARVEQHQHQIGDALEPVELRGGVHRPEPTASAVPVIAAARPSTGISIPCGCSPSAALAAGYLWATRRGDGAATGRQKLLFLGGVVLLAAALTWPLGDLASHWLLLALVLQRLLLTLAVRRCWCSGRPAPSSPA